MKKKFAVFGLVALLAASVTAAVCATSNQKSTQLVADAYNDKVSLINGLFEKVTDLNSIQDDEQLLVLADGRYTFQFFVGASYHYWMTTEFSEFTDVFNNGSVLYANDVKGELVTFDKNDDGTYYLKLNHFVDYAFDRGSIKSGYIVHDAYDNRGVTSFGDLFFRESKNKPNANQSKWRVTKDQYGHTTITSVSGRQLHWKQCGGYSWSSFIATPHTEWSSNIELYRKVNDTFGTTVAINHAPNKTTYSIGDEVDLTGLTVTATLPSGATFSASYDSKSYLFTNLDFVSYYNAVFFDFCGIRWYFNVTVNNGLQNEQKYLKDSSKIVDPRGTYLLGVFGGRDKSILDYGMELNFPFILNLFTHAIKTSEDTFQYSFGEIIPISPLYPSSINPISDLIYSSGTGQGVEYIDNDLVVENRVKIVLEEGKYYLRGLLHGNYLYSNSGTLTSTSSLTGAGNDITIDSENHILTHNDADIFVVDTTNNLNMVKTVSISSLPNENYKPLELYKLQLNSNSSMAETVNNNLNSFKTSFYEKTASYKSGVSSSNWESLKSSFNNLYLYYKNSALNDLQGYLASIEYNHNHENANTFEEMIDIYDQIIFLHNLEDFMGRRASGSLYDYRNVNLSCENGTISGAAKAYHTSNYVAQITIDSGTMHYPETIEVLMNGSALNSGTDYTYNNENGAITINAGVITEDIIINASATRYAYRVKYLRNTPVFATYFEETVNVEPGTYTLRSPQYTSIYIPEGKEFKCWLVDSEEVNPGETITLTDDVTITPLFKEMKAVEELNYRETVSSLSYDYEVLGENSYSFSNVVLRFGGLISKSSWDQLDNTFRADEQSRGILGYGILIYTNKLGDFEQLTPSNATYDLFVDTANKEHPNVASDSVKTANHITGEDFNNDYYTWNLRVNVAEANFTSDITAVAYVKTATNGYMYFGQITTSVKKQANEMLLNRGYADEDDGSDDYDGSLVYLAGL